MVNIWGGAWAGAQFVSVHSANFTKTNASDTIFDSEKSFGSLPLHFYLCVPRYISLMVSRKNILHGASICIIEHISHSSKNGQSQYIDLMNIL